MGLTSAAPETRARATPRRRRVDQEPPTARRNVPARGAESPGMPRFLDGPAASVMAGMPGAGVVTDPLTLDNTTQALALETRLERSEDTGHGLMSPWSGELPASGDDDTPRAGAAGPRSRWSPGTPFERADETAGMLEEGDGMRPSAGTPSGAAPAAGADGDDDLAASSMSEAGPAPDGAGDGSDGTDGGESVSESTGAAPDGSGDALTGGGGASRLAASVAAPDAGPASSAADDALHALDTGSVALIDTELAEHLRWGAASARVGSAGSADRADFVARSAGAGAVGGFLDAGGMGLVVGAGTRAAEIAAARGAGALAARSLTRLYGPAVARLAGPALARSAPIPAIGAVVGGVFSAIDLATRDWSRTGETIGRFGEGGSIYEQLANSIAAVSEVIGIATAVLNVIAGVIGAISIAMWVITVLTVGVASPLALTLSTIAGAIGIATMILDAINALVLQRLVTLFRALHTFTSQADPSDVEAQGGRIGEAAGASAGFAGGMVGGLAGGFGVGRGARRLGIPEHPTVPGVEPPRPAGGDGPTITADPPPLTAEGLPSPDVLPAGDRPALLPPEPTAPAALPEVVPPGDRPAMLPPEPVMPAGAPDAVLPMAQGPGVVDPHGPTLPAADPHAPTLPAADPHAATMPAVDPHAPTMPAVDPHGSTIPAADPHAPTAIPDGPGGMPEIPGPPRLPDIGPLPDYGPELPGWNPDAPSPYAPTDVPPPLSSRPTVDPHGATVPAAPEAPAVPGPRRIADTAGPVPDAAPAAPAAPVDPTSFADVNSTVADVANSPFGDRLASEAMAPMQDVPRDTTRSPSAVRDAAYADIPNNRPAGWDGPAGLQDQHWTKVRDATVNAPAGTPPATVEAINSNRSPLQTFVGEPSSLLLTTEGVPASSLPTGNEGTRYFIGDAPMGRPAVPAEPGIAAIPAEPGAPGGPARDPNYRSGHRFADRHLIPEMALQIQDARARAGLPPLDPVQLSVAAGEQARYVMEGVPRTDLAGNPVEPWSGFTVDRPRDPMQMLLAPEVLSPDAHARGRTVDPGPRPVPDAAPASRPAPDPNQLNLFGDGAVASPDAALPAAPHPVSEAPRPVADAPTRSTRPLTPAEFDAHARMLSEQYGVPIERIRPGDYTAFHPGATPADGYITIGPDVNPLPAGERPTGLANPANAALEPQAVLAHESLGHRDAELAGQVRPQDTRPGVADPNWHEEFQASTRAALLDPTLPADQFQALRDDAAARLRHRPDDGTIYVWTEPLNPADRPAAPSAPRPDSHFRPQDQLPSVIINLDAAGPGSPGATGGAPRGAGAVVPEGGGGAPRPAVDPTLTPPAPVLTGRRPTPGGIVIEEFGRPGVDNLNGLDVDATVAALDPGANGRPGATSDTYFEYPAGRDVRPGVLPAHGLQDVSIRTNADPTKIQYHENMDFSGATQVRMAEAGSITPGERGATTGRAGTPHTSGSVLPDDPSRVLSTAVPQYGPNSSKAGQPLPLEARMHSANPSPTLAAHSPNAYSRFNHTVQINTGKNTRYLLPDGRWVPMNSPDIGPAHHPAGGRDRGPTGLGEVPGIPGGVPTPRPIADPGRVNATTASTAATAGAGPAPVVPPANMTAAYLPQHGTQRASLHRQVGHVEKAAQLRGEDQAGHGAILPRLGSQDNPGPAHLPCPGPAPGHPAR